MHIFSVRFVFLSVFNVKHIPCVLQATAPDGNTSAEDALPSPATKIYSGAAGAVEAAAAVIDRVGSAPDLIASYFAIEDPKRLEPHAREFGFETPLTPTFNIRGYVDRIDKAPDGRIRIVDYKTGKAPRAQYQDKPMFQMRFYALAWWRIHEVVPAMLQLLFLGNREILRYEPTESDLLATERRVLSVRDAISAAADKGEFTPTPSKLCDWCDHQSICPAKGGTPPPIPPRDLWLEKTPFTKR